MEQSTRRYIKRLLALHAAALVLAVAVVTYAGRALYAGARAQGEAQAVEQARRPAGQAADGIRRHLGRVLDGLSLGNLASADGRLATWHNLRDAVSDLLVIGDDEVVRLHVANEPANVNGGVAAFAVDPADVPAELTRALPDREGRGVQGALTEVAAKARGAADGRAIVGPVAAGSGAIEPVILVGASSANGRPAVAAAETRVAVAVVPVAYLERAFLALSRDPGRLALALAAPEFGLAVGEVSGDEVPLSLRRFVSERLEGQSPPSRLIGGEATFDGETFNDMLPAVVRVRGVAPPVAADTSDFELAVVGVLDGEAVVGPLATLGRTAVLWTAAVIAIFTAILVSSSWQLIKGRARIERLRAEVVESELEAARKIQLTWLPDDGPQHLADHEVDLAAQNLPASHISGDFYNHFELPGRDASGGKRLALVIGDVTGHGMAAAFLMSTAQLLAEAALRRDADPGHALSRVNAQLARQAHGGQFVTLLLAVIDADAGEVQLAAAGHAGPLVYDDEGRWHQADVEGDLVAGVMAEVEYATTRIPLAGLRGMLFYTDGAIEAKNLDGQRFSLEGLIAGLAARLPDGPEGGRSIVEAGLATVREFAEGQEFEDDVTFLGIDLTPAETEGGEAIEAPDGGELVGVGAGI